MVIRLGRGATLFNPRTGRNVGDDAPPKKNSGDEARELLAHARSQIAALGMVPGPAKFRNVAIEPSTSVVKSNDGATPAAIRAHPDYKDAHERGFAMVARSRGFDDGCTAATQILYRTSEPTAPLGVTNANRKR